MLLLKYNKTVPKGTPFMPKEDIIMATTKNTKKVEETKKAATVKTTEKKVTENKVAEKKPANKEKKNVAPTVRQMTNVELNKLFSEHGLASGSKAKSDSVVYQQFGTQSRVLQQKRAYQLLLTNGHKKVKEDVVECENNDVARFNKWYAKLNKEDKTKIKDAESMTKLSDSELPREMGCKITDYDLLLNFLDFMATFEENKLPVAAK